MAKKLKEFSIFGGKKYNRGSAVYNTKENAIKRAKKLKSMGVNVVRDKNSKGHFLWTYVKPKSELTQKEKEEIYIETFTEPIPKSKSKLTIGSTEAKILKYLRYKINMKKEKDIRRKIFKDKSIQSSLDSLKDKGLITVKGIARYHGDEPIKHYSISTKGEGILSKIGK